MPVPIMNDTETVTSVQLMLKYGSIHVSEK